jgi:chitodextrinase
VPQGQRQAGATATTMTMVWNASTDNVAVAGYNVYLDGDKIASTTSTSYTYKGLACGKTYTVGLEAYDAAGNRSNIREAMGPMATSACSTSPPPPPASPPPTPATPPSPPASPPPSPPASPPPSPPASPPPPPPPASPPPPPPAGGADRMPPSAPAGVSVTGASGSTITLSWNAASDNVGVTGYGLYRNGGQVGSVTSLNGTIADLTCGTAVTVGVDSVDAAGNRSARSDIVATTSPCPDTQAPTAPTNLIATARTSTTIALAWGASGDNVGVTGYEMFIDGARVESTPQTTGIASNLACGRNYTVGVAAFDAAGNHSPQTVIIVATTGCPDTQAPTAPSGLKTSNATRTSIDIAWSPSTDNVGVVEYRLFRNGAQAGQTSAISHRFSSLSCGTNYTLGVDAHDAAGNASPRASVAAMTNPCAVPPPPPSGTTVVGTGASLNAAIANAKPGDTLELASGTHQTEILTGDPGGTVYVQGRDGARFASEITIDGLRNIEFQNVSFDGGLYVGAHENPQATGMLTFRNVHTKYAFQSSVHDVLWEDCDVGGTVDGTQGMVIRSAYGKRSRSRNVTIRRCRIHDITRDQNPSAHTEGIFVAEVDGLLIENSVFENNDIFNIFVSTWSEGLSPRNVTFRGNTFRPTGNYSLMWRNDGWDPGYWENILVENNWFQEPMAWSDDYPASLFRNFVFRGNYGAWSPHVLMLAGVSFEDNHWGQNPPTGWQGS